MITPELIQQINALAKKKRTEGLTPAEQEEQTRLRQIYLATIRQRVEHTLQRIEFVDKPQE